MKLSNALAGAAVVALGMAGSASAGTVTDYNNPYVFGAGGDCSFSTTCAAANARGDDFAAQEFTLAAPTVVTGASFTELDLGTTPTAVNWGFALNDGAGGLPGTLLSAGLNTITSSASLGVDGPYNVTQLFFGVGPQLLGPGTYYFALQAISPVSSTFLGGGAAASGAAETMDGGVTWAANYEGYSSVAVSLYTYVPEPAAWALMLVGVGAVGGALRRRAARTTSIA